jgi:hypothetical protein
MKRSIGKLKVIAVAIAGATKNTEHSTIAISTTADIFVFIFFFFSPPKVFIRCPVHKHPGVFSICPKVLN